MRGSEARRRQQTNRQGLSEIETVVAILVALILAVLVLPAVERARGSAMGNRTRDQLRRVGVGMYAYHATHNSFPK